MSLPMIFDIVVSCLLLATIVYAVALNRRLTVIQNSREELQALLNHFSESLARAEEGIRELRNVANLVGSDLNSEIKKGSALKDDLSFLIERGDKLANELEDKVRHGRNTVSSHTPQPSKIEPVKTSANTSSSPESQPASHTTEEQRTLSAKEQKILSALTGLR